MVRESNLKQKRTKQSRPTRWPLCLWNLDTKIRELKKGEAPTCLDSQFRLSVYAVDRAEDEEKVSGERGGRRPSVSIRPESTPLNAKTKNNNKKIIIQRQKPSFALVQKRQLAHTQQVSPYWRRQKIRV